jgi:hypothetical protein
MWSLNLPWWIMDWTFKLFVGASDKHGWNFLVYWWWHSWMMLPTLGWGWLKWSWYFLTVKLVGKLAVNVILLEEGVCYERWESAGMSRLVMAAGVCCQWQHVAVICEIDPCSCDYWFRCLWRFALNVTMECNCKMELGLARHTARTIGLIVRFQEVFD